MPSKRSLSPVDADTPDAKRPRVSESTSETTTPSTTSTPALQEKHDFVSFMEDEEAAVESQTPTQHWAARCGLQRSIALVLKHDGFDTATPEAIESFTQLAETYVDSLIQQTKLFANTARRDLPTPLDFEAALRHHNLSVASLKPHLKNPLSAQQLAPTFTNVQPIDSEAYTTLPLLGEELSGKADKAAQLHIPSNYPEFPSRHTYSFTPQEDTKVRDSKKTREEAAKIAQQGENALRQLVRASKTRKQKEAKTLVERDEEGKERFRLWEMTMKRFKAADGKGAEADANAELGQDTQKEKETADYSMIVNGDAQFWRKEVSRQKKRPTAGGSRN